MTQRTHCDTPGHRKRTAPSCHDGCVMLHRPESPRIPNPHRPNGVHPCPKPSPSPGVHDVHPPRPPCRDRQSPALVFRPILTLHGLIRLADVAELVAAELVSNAVRHTKGQAALRVQWRAGVLRIGAGDADPQPPEPSLPWDLLSMCRRAAASPSYGPARICGARSRWPRTDSAASTCGASWRRPSFGRASCGAP